MKRIALIGMPNTGKSTLFNRISGSSVKVANWPGITVDLYSVKTLIHGELTELIDLPGIYDLNGYSEDEIVVQNILKENNIDEIFFVLNSSQIDRQLPLAIEVMRLGFPMVILANMIDESKKYGISFDFEKMEKLLGCSVLPISAKYGQGMASLHQKIQAKNKRLINGGVTINSEVEAKRIINSSVIYPPTLNDQNSARLDSLFLHPWLGLPIFLLIIFAVFQIVFSLGSPLQELMGSIFSYIQSTLIVKLTANLNPLLNSFLIEGLYAGISTVASFVPIIILFFFAMTIVEDSGYFSRAAFLMDKTMERMGLDGRGFVLMLMGFGCNVPALMGTKIMRSKEIRFLTMLVIPFSLCSARLQVFLFLIAAFFSSFYGALVLFSLYLLSFFTIFITAVIFKHQYVVNDPLVLELPPYRLPTLKQILNRGWVEVNHFLNRATKFIIIGVVSVWALTHFPEGYPVASEYTYAGKIGLFFDPVFRPIGIDPLLIVALIFGFIAKEILIGALAVIFGLEGHALGTHLADIFTSGQGLSFMIFTLIYTPCVSTIATIKSESKSLRLTAYSLLWSLILAWAMSFIFYQSYLFLMIK
ncbi:MAG TPA: ferrous iron transport protein B [Methylophilaceae bacterium]|jgi:ferrous iron transport protein B|nr:ferrous iron transport protein B [Methylophilaceae bacterium]|tara:strand:- start:16206 stop:17969 length:1764 start_codon:yes stop_codon:yes gene_type:complete